MTFPGAGARVYYNEAGEPLGWDYPSYDEGDNDPYDDYDRAQNREYEDDEWCEEHGQGNCGEDHAVEIKRDYYITFEVNVQASDEDEAVEAAKSLIRRRDFEPTSVEVEGEED